MPRLATLVAVSFAAWIAFGSAAVRAQDQRAMQQLEQKGFKRCAKVAGNVLEFLYEKQSYAYLNTWHNANPDTHIASTITIAPAPNGQAFASVITAPTAAGSCDAAFSQIVPIGESCVKIQEKTFKDWKKVGDMSGVTVYADPTAPNVMVMLFPAPQAPQAACLVLKSGVLFF